MSKRKNYKVDYEAVYLFENQLKNSVSAGSEAFINNEETSKIINHSAGNSFRKNYTKLKVSGIDIDDVITVARCYSMIFWTRYRNNFKNKKHMYYSLCRYLGQKLYRYVTLTEKKFPENRHRVDVVSKSIANNNDTSSVSAIDYASEKWRNISARNTASSDEIIETARGKIDLFSQEISTRQLTNLKRVSDKFHRKSMDEIRRMSHAEHDKYQYYSLANEVYSKYLSSKKN